VSTPDWKTYTESGQVPAEGEQVFARYSVDNKWYRGYVDEVKQVTVTILTCRTVNSYDWKFLVWDWGFPEPLKSVDYNVAMTFILNNNNINNNMSPEHGVVDCLYLWYLYCWQWRHYP